MITSIYLQILAFVSGVWGLQPERQICTYLNYINCLLHPCTEKPPHRSIPKGRVQNISHILMFTMGTSCAAAKHCTPMMNVEHRGWVACYLESGPVFGPRWPPNPDAFKFESRSLHWMAPLNRAINIKPGNQSSPGLHYYEGVVDPEWTVGRSGASARSLTQWFNLFNVLLLVLPTGVCLSNPFVSRLLILL